MSNVHGNKEKNKAKCVICEEEFPQEYIKEHMKRVHEGEKVCGICKKHFRNSKMLSEHRKNAHENLAGYECFYCPIFQYKNLPQKTCKKGSCSYTQYVL